MQRLCLYFFALVEFNLTKIVAFVLKTDFFFFFNWDSLHARLNSHYEAWSYKKKKKKSTKKITGYRKLD